MKTETIKNYQSNVNFIRRLTFVLLIIQMVVASFHLFVPSFIDESILRPIVSIALGVVVNLIGLLMAAKIVDLDGLNLTKFYRFLAIAGLYHQYVNGVNTIYTITIFVIAVIGENILIPKLQILSRTQNFASHEKLTPEVYQAIQHADNYLEGQVKWVVNALMVLISVAIISIFLITLVNILPVILPNVTIIQYISVIALCLVLGVIIVNGFPEFDQNRSQYDLN